MDKYFKFDNLNETLPVIYDHLEVGGCTMCESWDGIKGFIEMDPFNINLTWEQFRNIEHDAFIEKIKNGINDGGFGCKEIIGGHVWIKAVYVNDTGNEVKCYIDNMYVGVSRELTTTDINEISEYIDENL